MAKQTVERNIRNTNRKNGKRKEYGLVLWCVALLLASCIFGSAALAQVLYGSLTGTITDPSGAAVGGAKVGALNVETGVVQEGVTDLNGIYRFSALLPGVYKVTVTMAGFDTQVTQNVRLEANEVQRVNAQLKIATAAANVVVTGETPLL